METDWAVGRVMETLEREGLRGDTLLIFTTDNGTAPEANFKRLEAHGIDLRNHFSGHKGMIREGGHRIPLVARWPGRIRPGSVCGQTVCLTDLMATAADLLGCGLPDGAGEDSTSILPLLLGKKESLPGHPPVIHHDYGGNFAVRDGKWKLLAGSGKLYDMENDVKERKNVAARHPGIVKKLSAALEKCRAEGRSRPSAKKNGGG